MNKRNFGKVLKFIEANPTLWRQDSCQECFLVHALRILVPRSRARSPYNSRTLALRMGVSMDDLSRLYGAQRTLASFRLCHKLGVVI